VHWLTRFFRKTQSENQLDAELRDHLERQISDYTAAGMPPEEARRRARLDFGGLESIKQQTRESRRGNFLESLFQDLRYAIRNLRKDRRFAMIAIFALALGIGASTVVFSIFYNLFFNAFAAKDASRLVVPVIQDTGNTGRADSNLQPLTFPLTDLDVIREQNQVFENIVGYMPGAFVLANDGSQMYQFNGTRVTSDAFDFYGVPPLLGRGIALEDGKPGAPPVFVMSYKTWKGVFREDSRILGKILTIDGEPRTLVGVMPQRFQAYGLQAEIWIPVTRSLDTPRADEESKASVLARMKPGLTLEAASADLDLIVKRLALLHPDDFPKHFAARIQSARDSLLGPQGGATTFHSDMKHLLYDLLAAVAMLLLIACSNVANLLLARATVREKEMAVRSALGATRGRLVRQLLAESSVLAMAACIVGCLFAWFGMKFVPAIIPRSGDIYGGGHLGAETTLGLNAPVLFFALALTVLTTLICGLAPALRVARTDIQPQLAGTGKGVNGVRHGKLRAALVVAEVALAIVLLVGTGLMMRSFFLLTHVDLGFNPKNVLFVVFAPPLSHNKISATPHQKFASPQGLALLRDIAERLKSLPGVTHVAIEDAMPGYSPSRGYKVSVLGVTHTEEVGLFACDENLVPTLELRMVQGRWLTEQEVRTAQHVGVISQRLAHDYFGDANPIGQQLQVKAFKGASEITQDAEFQIVGVVKDVISAGPQRPTMPMIFLPYTVRGGFLFLLKTTVEPASLAHAVQEQVWAVDRDEIIGLSSPLEDFLQRFTYATPEFGLLIAAPLAIISLILVIVGVFSVMAYTVSLQTQEIGIRMALGAQQSSILQMILTKGARLLATGIVLGLFASYSLTRFLASQIWGVSATDPWTFTAVAAFVVAVGLGACFLPARRATRVDPLTALHYE
jgi:predicted permease